VIGDDVDGQLAPYDENIEVAPYRDYLGKDYYEMYFNLYAEQTGLKTKPTRRKLAAWLTERYGQDEPYYWDEEKNGVYTMSTYSPRSKWDWYTIGGRWMGYFKLKEGAVGFEGRPGVFDNDPIYEGGVDVARKCDIDLEGMRSAAGEAAGDAWDRAHEVFGNTPEPEPWASVLERYGRERVEKARAFYNSQPRVRVTKEHDQEAMEDKRHEDVISGFMGDGPEGYSVSREVYVHRARDSAICPYAYVKDGEWFAPGNMGWWGTSSDEEEDRLRFRREFNEMLDALPDDEILTLLDLHI
jgi:hypothetical protein